MYSIIIYPVLFTVFVRYRMSRVNNSYLPRTVVNKIWMFLTIMLKNKKTVCLISLATLKITKNMFNSNHPTISFILLAFTNNNSHKYPSALTISTVYKYSSEKSILLPCCHKKHHSHFSVLFLSNFIYFCLITPF